MGERLVVHKHWEPALFQYKLYGRLDHKKLPVKGRILLLSRLQSLGEETWLAESLAWELLL
jgi:hypothetical protein